MLINITGIIDPQFVMNHLDDLDPKRGISWQTVQVSPFSIFLSSPAQFMLAEVQYGGRVTDDFDKRLLNTFTNVWFNDQLLVTGFKFYDGYTLPDCKTVEEYSEFITNLPIQVTLCKSSAPICFQDIPEVFGLHANADITYQINTAKGVLDQVNQCFLSSGIYHLSLRFWLCSQRREVEGRKERAGSQLWEERPLTCSPNFLLTTLPMK